MTLFEPTDRVPIAAPTIGEREKARVRKVLESGQLAAGEEVEQFEQAFSAYAGSDHAIAATNGTAALQTALESVGIGDGDVVVTTPFSFVATANAVRFCGATPIFADIDPETYNLDPDSVEERIRTHDGEVDAILVVHLYGHPADMDRFRDLADRFDVPLVEDAAQAHGARIRDQHVGSIGDVGAFSFYPTKNMTTGEGGMVVTDDEAIARRARRFVDHGRSQDGYEHVTLGHNFRMSEMAAAVGRVQLIHLPDYVRARRDNARELTDVVSETSLTAPIERPDAHHAYHQYTVRSQNRDALVAFLDDFGVDAGVYYPTLIYDQPAYEAWDETCPEAERVATEVVSLPVHPAIDEDDRHTLRTALEYFDTYER